MRNFDNFENFDNFDNFHLSVVIPESQKQKALKFREKQLAEDLASRRQKFKENQMSNFDESENNENINEIMNKISMMELPRELKDELVRKIFASGNS